MTEGRVSSYTVEAASEDENERRELRRYSDRWEIVRMRRSVGGGWYVRDSLDVMTPARVQSPCCDDGPAGHTQQQHHDASPCYDMSCTFDHPHGGPYPPPDGL